jgi:hypothetical protein
MGRRRHPAPHARDEALRRLRRLTASAAAGGMALAAGFAGLAAHAVPGRKVSAGSATTSGTLRLAAQAPRRHHVKSAPKRSQASEAPESSAGSSSAASAAAPAPAPAPAPSPPPVPPAPTPAPPVVVSGGS